jgi:SAM-dependent methyltransferase
LSRPTPPTPLAPEDPGQRWRESVGDAWARLQAEIDSTFAPFTAALLQAADARAGERALDIGCGTGELSLALACAVGPDGRVVGLDLSPAQLEVARDRAAAARLAVEFVEADAAAWPSPAPFDLLASRLGTMFFPDSVGAFAHLRAQAPSGRLAMLCWAPSDENPWMRLLKDAAAGLLALPPEAPPGSPGPFAFDDPTRIQDILAESGWRRIAVARLDTVLAPAGGTPDAALRFAQKLGPLAAAVAEAEPAIRDRVRAALVERLARWTADGRVAVPAAAWIVTAHAA